MDIHSLLQQRRSIRHFDETAKISPAELESLLDAAKLAPSGNNSQPWRFVAITDPALREQLLPIAFSQQQIMSASAVLLLLADSQAYSAQNLTRIHQEEYEAGCFNAEIRDFLTQAAIHFYQPFNETDTVKSLALDAGLCAMSLMLVAEARGWQTVPMTGYQPALLRQLFNLPHRYLDIMMIAIGKGLQPGHQTLRHPTKELLTWNAPPSRAHETESA